MASRFIPRGFPERDPLRLLRVDGQAEAPKPLGQYFHDSPCIAFQRAADDEIVGKTYQEALTFHSRPCHFDEPIIQHVVEEDICQHWGDHAALRRTRLRMAPYALVHDAGIKPLSNQAYYASIVNTDLDPLSQPGTIDVVEEATDVCIHYPADLSSPRTAGEAPSTRDGVGDPAGSHERSHRNLAHRWLLATSPQPAGRSCPRTLAYLSDASFRLPS